MNDTSAMSSQDRAIEHECDDALNRGPFIQSLIRALTHTERSGSGEIIGMRSTGYVVGITGQWGLGKSSILNLLKEQLSDNRYVAVANINPWLFSSRDDLLKAYFNALRDALGKTLKERARDLQNQLDKYKGAIGLSGAMVAGAIDLTGGGGWASALWAKKAKPTLDAISKPKDLSPDEERIALETKLKAANIAVVVLIDELDRVEDDEVRTVAQLIKAVGDIKGISYLVAYDPLRVAMALGRGTSPSERLTNGEAYLEKIIQFAVPIRPLFADDVRSLIEKSFLENSIELPVARSEYQSNIIDEIVRSVETPREIKRLISAFSVLEQMVRGEVCPYDVLGYCWIATKAPAIRDKIARDLEVVVSDPSVIEQYRRMGARGDDGKKMSETLSDVFGQAASPHEKMLKLLFPRFGQEEGITAGNRISKRRNLVRLLYLGNPPGMLPRSRIEKLWRANSIDEANQSIRNILQSAQLPSLLDRLADLMPQFDGQNSDAFWLGLAGALVRDHDWILEQEVLGNFVDDVGQILWNFGRQNDEYRIQVIRIFESLVADGDLLVAPWLLRKHLFALGMTTHAKPTDSTIFSLIETENYLEQEIPRYISAIKSGFFLKRLPDTEIVYTIYNANRWTNELRNELTSQLDGVEPITTFAALTVKPGHIVDRSTMDTLIQSDIVLARVVDIAKNNLLPTDPWLMASMTRFAATLRGHDPHFVRDHASDDYIANGLAPAHGQVA